MLIGKAVFNHFTEELLYYFLKAEGQKLPTFDWCGPRVALRKEHKVYFEAIIVGLGTVTQGPSTGACVIHLNRQVTIEVEAENGMVLTKTYSERSIPKLLEHGLLIGWSEDTGGGRLEIEPQYRQFLTDECRTSLTKFGD